MYTYKRTEFSPHELYTVGTYDSGKWEPESDHNTADEAVKRTAFLNGSSLPTEPKEEKAGWISVKELKDRIEGGGCVVCLLREHGVVIKINSKHTCELKEYDS